MAIEQSTASTALANVAINPSPVFFTSVPEWAASTSRRAVKCARRVASHFASPSRDSRSVEPTMSVNRIEMVPPVLIERC